MGLLPDIASTFAITEPTAGHLISAYAVGVVIGAPVIAALTARLPRKALLLALIAVFTLGNLASVLAPSYPTLLLARFVAGLPHGAFFGIAALTAAHLMGPQNRAKAVAYVLSGLLVLFGLTFLPTDESGGFQPGHAAGAQWCGWSSNSSRFPAGSCFAVASAPAGAEDSRQAMTASPAANIFLAAFTSACSAGREQWMHRNTAWLSRDLGSTCPHAEQHCDVYAAGTFTTCVPV